MAQAKPRITMVAGHCCIRVHKMAVPLATKGYEVRLILNRYPTAVNHYYSSIMIVTSMAQLWDSIKVVDSHTDIYHCHNEPNWLVSAVKEASNKPVILDWHDSYLLRRAESEEEGARVRITIGERNNAFLADGFCFVCDPMKEVVFKEFPGVADKPHCTLWSHVPQIFYRYDSHKWLGGVCYEGRVDTPDLLKKNEGEWDFFAYSEYTKLAKELKTRGIPFFIYPGRSEVKDYYKDLATTFDALDFPSLIWKIGRHDWGLIGNIDSHREWESAMPNKLFEYIAAQLPIVALNAGHAGEWVEKEGIGINIKNLDELEARWDEREERRNTLIGKRLQYTMENNIQPLEELYETLVHL